MDLSPREIVKELDKYIIGQGEAKRAVAVALRNRYRRSMLSPELREEITPKNRIMKGPTGVGKTKLSIELAKKYNAVVHLIAHPRKAQYGQNSLDKSDISGSANLTNLADYVMIVQRIYEEDNTDKHTELTINKDRYMGCNGKVYLLFDKDRRRFYCKDGNGEELEVNYLLEEFEQIEGEWIWED